MRDALTGRVWGDARAAIHGRCVAARPLSRPLQAGTELNTKCKCHRFWARQADLAPAQTLHCLARPLIPGQKGNFCQKLSLAFGRCELNK